MVTSPRETLKPEGKKRAEVDLTQSGERTMFFFGDSIQRNLVSYIADRLGCQASWNVVSRDPYKLCYNPPTPEGQPGEFDDKFEFGSWNFTLTECPFPHCEKLRVFWYFHAPELEDDASTLRRALRHAAPITWVIGEGVLHYFDIQALNKGEFLYSYKGELGVIFNTLAEESPASPFWLTMHKRNTKKIPSQYRAIQSNAIITKWNRVARAVAATNGVRVVDVENATMPYMNETDDGTHFRSIVQAAKARLLLSTICKGYGRYGDAPYKACTEAAGRLLE
jgi:hypothetical protein